MLRNLDTIYLDPDLVRISQPKLISGDHFFGLQRVRGSGNYDRKKKRYSRLSGGLCCCIVSIFGSGGKLAVFLLRQEIFIMTGKKTCLSFLSRLLYLY